VQFVASRRVAPCCVLQLYLSVCLSVCLSVVIQLSSFYEVSDRGKITDIEMGRACSTYEGEEKRMKFFVVEI
jgi:hypothetical protein